MQVGLLGPLPGQLGHPGHGLALFLALLYLLKHGVGHVGVLVQVVVHLGLHEVAHILVYAHPAARRHGERTELYLCLALKHGLLDVDGYGGHEPVAYVGVLEVLAVELLDGAGNVLLERALVGASLRGVLSIDKRVVLLAILVGVGEGNLDVLARQVYDGVYAVGGHGVVEQVLEAVPAEYAAAIVHYCQPGVQVCVVAEHRLHNVGVEGVAREQCGVRLEEYVRAVLVGTVLGGV